MRLFAALLPPEPVLDELDRAVGELHALPGAEELRWTERANWHITLAFYGEVPDGPLPALAERLSRAAARRAPMDLRIAGSGTFGRRALWAAIASGGAQDPPPDSGAGGDLRLLARSAAAAGRKAGLAMEDSMRFRAHLTVARVRERAAAARVDLRPYAEALGHFAGRTWTAGEVALVRSNLPTSGVPGEQPRYERLAAWPLGR